MTLRDALDTLLADYEVNGRSARPDRIQHLERHIDLQADVMAVDYPMLVRYAQARRKEGVSPATVNREISVLRRACVLSELGWPKKWRPLRESAPRTGFTTRDEVEQVCLHLDQAHADLARFLFLTGWRRGEGQNLRWSQVDFVNREVHLLAGTTKNKEPRVFPMYPQLYDLLHGRAVRLGGAALAHHVFGTPVHGCKLRAMNYHWRLACQRAGFPKLLLHDFRRTAARNLIAAGVDRQVAMKLLGHKTESIFNRYRITTNRDLEVAAAKLGTLLAS